MESNITENRHDEVSTMSRVQHQSGKHIALIDWSCMNSQEMKLQS